MLRRLSIKTRLLVVSAILIVILAASTLYMTAELAANARAVARTAELAKLQQSRQRHPQHFQRVSLLADGPVR